MHKINFDIVFLINVAGSALVHSYCFIKTIQVVLKFKTDSCSLSIQKVMLKIMVRSNTPAVKSILEKGKMESANGSATNNQTQMSN